jgi:transposase
MPYKHEKKKIPKPLDRRVKYSEADFTKVRDMYEAGQSQRAIARATGMSRRMISFVLFPEKYKHAKDLYQERRKDGRYLTATKTQKQCGHIADTNKN